MLHFSFLRFRKSSSKIRRKASDRATRLNSWRKLSVEPLEWRTLLAGDVAGTVLDDVNNDGIKNNGENGIAGVTVFVDLNLSGALDAGEPSAITNIDGDYLIRSVDAGTKNIRQIVPPGYVPSTGTANNQDVLVKNSTEVTVNFFDYKSPVGSIAGTVWQDLNGDGIRATDAGTGAFTDPGLSNWTVFVDLNNNRTPDAGELSTLTNSSGVYTFENLTPGDYEVTEVLPSGWEVAPTFDTRQTVAVADGIVSTGHDFANVDLTNGSIQGVVWNDFNGDGLRAADPVTGNFTEPGLAGWTVFLDTNNNRTVDVGEPSTLTDASGAYTFGGLLAGDYEVTEVLPSGWNVSPRFDSRQTVTVNGGQVSTAGDFANFSSTNGSIRGSIWNDVNANGTRDVDSVSGMFTEPVLVGWTVFLDLNGN